MNVSDLTPAMRACLGTAPAAAELRLGRLREPGLSGLYHGATLAALVRKGLATSEWDASLGQHEYRLTPAGLAARALIRDRVNERLVAHGCAPQEKSRLYAHPDWPHIMTRAAAMRRTGVTW